MRRTSAAQDMRKVIGGAHSATINYDATYVRSHIAAMARLWEFHETRDALRGRKG